MAKVSPDGPVYQAGTLSGNPLAMEAGKVMLDSLTPKVYQQLERTAASLEAGMKKAARELGVLDRLSFVRIGSISTMFFTPGPVENFDDAKKADLPAFQRYFHGMRKRGVFIAPAQFEAMFVSTAHGAAQIAATVKTHKEALKEAFELA